MKKKSKGHSAQCRRIKIFEPQFTNCLTYPKSGCALFVFGRQLRRQIFAKSKICQNSKFLVVIKAIDE